LSRLPSVPSYKQFLGEQTLEQVAMNNCVSKSVPAVGDIELLKHAIDFYKLCFNELEHINLDKMTKEEADKLLVYLSQIFTAAPIIGNELTVGEIYRASTVEDRFLEEGKIRDKKFLSYPPLAYIKARGSYNRCSGPDQTLFYACESENIGVRLNF
jgi:hypothetical protein